MAAGDLTVIVSSSDSTVGQLVNASISGDSLAVVVAAGASLTPNTVAGGGVAFDPVGAGTTTVTVGVTGFDPGVALASQVVTVTP